MSSRHGQPAKPRPQGTVPGKARRNQPRPSPASSRASGTRAPTRREQYDQHRLERQRELARQAQIRRITRRGAWAAGILALGLVVFLIVRTATSRGGTSTIGNIPGVKTYSGLAQTHVSGTVKYPQNPPVGGPHNATLLNCGIYDAPVRNENAVHSLEHGAVWITYQPNLAASDVQNLKSLVKGHAFVILSPYDGLPTPVVASAWGVQLQVQSAYDSRIGQFIQKYERGPQTPEQGAPCSGGTGTPTS